jgi:hypothetical protein
LFADQGRENTADAANVDFDYVAHFMQNINWTRTLQATARKRTLRSAPARPTASVC